MLHTQTISDLKYLPSSFRPKTKTSVSTPTSTSASFRPPLRRAKPLRTAALRRDSARDGDVSESSPSVARRQFLLLPSLAFAASCILSTARAEEIAPPDPAPSIPASTSAPDVDVSKEKNKAKEPEPEVLSRVYDATVIGEPEAVGKDRRRVWEKLMAARVVYLGEAEMVPDRDDRVLELEIVKNLKNRCAELERPVSVALEAFPRDLQEPLNQFMDGRLALSF